MQTAGKPKRGNEGLLTKGTDGQEAETKQIGGDNGPRSNARRACHEVGEGRVTGTPDRDLVCVYYVVYSNPCAPDHLARR